MKYSFKMIIRENIFYEKPLAAVGGIQTEKKKKQRKRRQNRFDVSKYSEVRIAIGQHEKENEIAPLIIEYDFVNFQTCK